MKMQRAKDHRRAGLRPAPHHHRVRKASRSSSPATPRARLQRPCSGHPGHQNYWPPRRRWTRPTTKSSRTTRRWRAGCILPHHARQLPGRKAGQLCHAAQPQHVAPSGATSLNLELKPFELSEAHGEAVAQFQANQLRLCHADRHVHTRNEKNIQRQRLERHQFSRRPFTTESKCGSFCPRRTRPSCRRRPSPTTSSNSRRSPTAGLWPCSPTTRPSPK